MLPWLSWALGAEKASAVETCMLASSEVFARNCLQNLCSSAVSSSSDSSESTTAGLKGAAEAIGGAGGAGRDAEKARGERLGGEANARELCLVPKLETGRGWATLMLFAFGETAETGRGWAVFGRGRGGARGSSVVAGAVHAKLFGNFGGRAGL